MCVIEQRTYVHPDGKRETFEHVKSRCHLAGPGKTCRQVVYEERTMPSAGHSRHSPRIRYLDESSSPASESLPPTPVNETTLIEVTPTSAGLKPTPSPKHRRKSSYGKVVLDFGPASKKDKKHREKKYHGSSAASTITTSSSSTRSFSPAPASPRSATYAETSSAHPPSHYRSYSGSSTRPAFATVARTPPLPSSRPREEHHILSTPTQAEPPSGPPGPPPPPAPTVPADPPSPEGSSKRKKKPVPPPIITHAPRDPPYPTSTKPHQDMPDSAAHHDGFPRRGREQDFADALSASLSAETGRTPAGETEGERYARLEQERYLARDKARKQQKEDEFWAKWHKERAEWREEGRKRHQEAQQKDDVTKRDESGWEADLEEGRQRLARDRTARTEPEPEPVRPTRRPTRKERRREEPQESTLSKDKEDSDWEAQLEAGRRRLEDLKLTEAAEIEAAAAKTRTGRNRAGSSHVGSSSTNSSNFTNPSSSSSSRPSRVPKTPRASGTRLVDEEAERKRLLDFEEQLMAHERYTSDATLAARITAEQEEIHRLEERIMRRDRERAERERSIEFNYNKYHASDSYNSGTGYRAENPRTSRGLGISGADGGDERYNPRYGMGAGARPTYDPSYQPSSFPQPYPQPFGYDQPQYQHPYGYGQPQPHTPYGYEQPHQPYDYEQSMSIDPYYNNGASGTSGRQRGKDVIRDAQMRRDRGY